MEPNQDEPASDLLLFARLTAKRAVDENDCWLWTGAKTSKGYGQLWHEGRNEYVHRLSARLFLGLDKGSDLYVLHACDVPSCFNPSHLFLGTQADNIDDANRKGRMGKRLTLGEVLEIRRRLKQGETQARVAEGFPVSKTTVGQIARRETWKYVPEPTDSPSLSAEDSEVVNANGGASKAGQLTVATVMA